MWMPCTFSLWTFQILKILEERPRTDRVWHACRFLHLPVLATLIWERDFFLIHIPSGSCISFSPLLSLAFYLESRLKIYKAINNGFPAGGEGLWWRFCDCLNRLHSCSVVTPFGCLPCFVESLMARFTLLPPHYTLQHKINHLLCVNLSIISTYVASNYYILLLFFIMHCFLFEQH